MKYSGDELGLIYLQLSVLSYGTQLSANACVW